MQSVVARFVVGTAAAPSKDLLVLGARFLRDHSQPLGSDGVFCGALARELLLLLPKLSARDLQANLGKIGTSGNFATWYRSWATFGKFSI